MEAAWRKPNFDPRSGGSKHAYRVDPASGIGEFIDSKGRVHRYKLDPDPNNYTQRVRSPADASRLARSRPAMEAAPANNPNVDPAQMPPPRANPRRPVLDEAIDASIEDEEDTPVIIGPDGKPVVNPPDDLEVDYVNEPLDDDELPPNEAGPEEVNRPEDVATTSTAPATPSLDPSVIAENAPMIITILTALGLGGLAKQIFGEGNVPANADVQRTMAGQLDGVLNPPADPRIQADMAAQMDEVLNGPPPKAPLVPRDVNDDDLLDILGPSGARKAANGPRVADGNPDDSPPKGRTTAQAEADAIDVLGPSGTRSATRGVRAADGDLSDTIDASMADDSGVDPKRARYTLNKFLRDLEKIAGKTPKDVRAFLQSNPAPDIIQQWLDGITASGKLTSTDKELAEKILKNKNIGASIRKSVDAIVKSATRKAVP